jgi:hypothetical protein
MKLSTRLIAASALTLISGLAAAQQSTELRISSEVAPNCTIAVRANAKAERLDLVRGEENTEIATVIENCNNPTGYSVTLASENRGNLMPRFDGRVEPVPYELSYDRADGRIGDRMVVYRDRPEFNRGAPLFITLRGNDQAVAGYYVDNVQLTISAR